MDIYEIRNIKSCWIIDSRGNPTIVTLIKTPVSMGVAAVPSGASTGSYEAVELRDNENYFDGKGVKKAVKNVNTIIKDRLLGEDVRNQSRIDYEMIELDGTTNKSNLGANAILSVSMAIARCAAMSKGLELYEYLGSYNKPPTPLMNVINGGVHAGNDLSIQETMIIPESNNFRKNIRMCCEVYQELKKQIIKKYGKLAVSVGDEGGFVPPIKSINESFELVLKAVKELGYENRISLGIDSAANEFYKNKKYFLEEKKFSSKELLDFYKSLCKKYPLKSIEDPFHENDFENTARLTQELKNVQIVGDDLFTTNTKRLYTGIKNNAGNALLLKLNQVGTITEAKQAMMLAKDNGYKVIVSHRSGDTCDSFISDLCVGWDCSQIKSGAPCRGERTSKYNRLLMIEEFHKD